MMYGVSNTVFDASLAYRLKTQAVFSFAHFEAQAQDLVKRCVIHINDA